MGTAPVIKSRSFCRNSLYCLLVLLAPVCHAQTQVYQPALHEGRWQVSGSPHACRLWQEVPRFGQVEFYHQAGESALFRLVPLEPVFAPGAIFVSSQPPAWNFRQAHRELVAAELVDGEQVLSLDEVNARRLLGELRQGLMPVFEGNGYFVDNTQVKVLLSAIDFQAPYQQYLACEKDLLPVNFSQIERSTIFWQSGAAELSDRDRQMLDDIVRYSEVDKAVYGFEVDSFTDTAGEARENLLLSERRAYQVTNYLVSRGIDPESIATRAHGEREDYLIINPERSSADRDRNRRVNIRVLRHPNGRIASDMQEPGLITARD